MLFVKVILHLRMEYVCTVFYSRQCVLFYIDSVCCFQINIFLCNLCGTSLMFGGIFFYYE